MPGGALGFLIVVNILVFILGCFIDFFEIAFIVDADAGAGGREDAAGISRTPGSLIWFGVMIAMNLQTSFLHAAVRLRAVLPAQRGRQEATTRTASPARRIPAVTTGADLQGRDRLHRACS